MQHSKVVGGSTAKRVLNCPGSVALVQRMPEQEVSEYAKRGSVLHECVERLLNQDSDINDVSAKLTEEEINKLHFCVDAIRRIDPDANMYYAQEVKVEFEGVKHLENVFGTVDFIGRIDDRVVVLDWKFGDGVAVPAEENDQLLFYAAAAMKTSELNWVFEDATEIELIIVQPPVLRRWTTTFKRLDHFIEDLQDAVKAASKPDAHLEVGDWCRWCAAKPICPKMRGDIQRVTHMKLESIGGPELGAALQLADKLEEFIAAARQLAQERLEKDMPVPGYKLVAKRPVRKWANERQAAEVLLGMNLPPLQVIVPTIVSPAQAERLLKQSKQALPKDLVVAVSSGSTLAPEDDPRPAVLNVGKQLIAAFSNPKL